MIGRRLCCYSYISFNRNFCNKGSVIKYTYLIRRTYTKYDYRVQTVIIHLGESFKTNPLLETQGKYRGENYSGKSCHSRCFYLKLSSKMYLPYVSKRALVFSDPLKIWKKKSVPCSRSKFCFPCSIDTMCIFYSPT